MLQRAELDYEHFSINRRQAQAIAFMVLNDIEEYIRVHQTEYQEFLSAEAKKGRGNYTQAEVVKRNRQSE
jgi:hypothetical protein